MTCRGPSSQTRPRERLCLPGRSRDVWRSILPFQASVFSSISRYHAVRANYLICRASCKRKCGLSFKMMKSSASAQKAARQAWALVGAGPARLPGPRAHEDFLREVFTACREAVPHVNDGSDKKASLRGQRGGSTLGRRGAPLDDMIAPLSGSRLRPASPEGPEAPSRHLRKEPTRPPSRQRLTARGGESRENRKRGARLGCFSFVLLQKTELGWAEGWGDRWTHTHAHAHALAHAHASRDGA